MKRFRKLLVCLLPVAGRARFWLFLTMRKIALSFGLIVLCSLILFQTGKYAYYKNTLPIEWLIGIFSAVFLIVGILIAGKQQKPSPSEAPSPAQTLPVSNITRIDSAKISELGISKREYEVLCEISQGLSNQEIAERLFLTESTIKTHISSILLKLNAKRRTEAVKIAKELKIIN
jgi:DNA-binding CsgD family transcriptional regulator